MNIGGFINVVELETSLRTLLVCSQASVFTFFNESYLELLNADVQLVWFLS